MDVILNWVSGGLLLLGLAFFVSGTAGLLRFPDVYTRLHAVSKADTLALGLIALALALQADSLVSTLKIQLIWLLVLVTGATSTSLIAGAAISRGLRPWQR